MDITQAPYDRLKICGDLHILYDLLAFLYRNIDKRQVQKPYGARTCCIQHKRLSPRASTVSKKS